MSKKPTHKTVRDVEVTATPAVPQAGVTVWGVLKKDAMIVVTAFEGSYARITRGASAVQLLESGVAAPTPLWGYVPSNAVKAIESDQKWVPKKAMTLANCLAVWDGYEVLIPAGNMIACEVRANVARITVQTSGVRLQTKEGGDLYLFIDTSKLDFDDTVPPPSQDILPGDREVAAMPSLHMRVSASADAPSLGQLPTGAVVHVKKASPDGLWYGFEFEIGDAPAYTGIDLKDRALAWSLKQYFRAVSSPPPVDPPPVDPPPVDPPPTNKRDLAKWGLHCMYAMAAQGSDPATAVDEAYRLGARFFNTLDVGHDGWIKQAKKYPDAWFICRKIQEHGFIPDPAQLADAFNLSGDWPANCIIVGLNEDDNGTPFSSIDGMQRRFQFDQDFYAIIKQRAPKVRYAASVYFPTDKPEEKALADLFKSTYVAWANQGGDRWIDFHNYARDENSLWEKNAAGEEVCDFYEMRAIYGLRLGLNPAMTKVIYSESGMDKMGHGGFNQLGYTNETLLRWMLRYDELHKAKGLDQLVLGCAFYQLGDSYPPPLGRGGMEQGKWWGYEMWGLRDGMRSLYAQGATK